RVHPLGRRQLRRHLARRQGAEGERGLRAVRSDRARVGRNLESARGGRGGGAGRIPDLLPRAAAGRGRAGPAGRNWGGSAGLRDSPLVVAFTALLIHMALMAAYVAAPKWSGDLSALVCVDRERLGQPPFRHVRVGFPDGGYDGQAYYVIAQNPWRRQDAA